MNFFLTPSTTVTLFSSFFTSSSYPDTLSFQPHPQGWFKPDILSLRFVHQNICRRNAMYSKFYPRRVASMHTHIRRPKSLTVSKVLRKRQKIKNKKNKHRHTHTHLYIYVYIFSGNDRTLSTSERNNCPSSRTLSNFLHCTQNTLQSGKNNNVHRKLPVTSSSQYIVIRDNNTNPDVRQPAGGFL